MRLHPSRLRGLHGAGSRLRKKDVHGVCFFCILMRLVLGVLLLVCVRMMDGVAVAECPCSCCFFFFFFSVDLKLALAPEANLLNMLSHWQDGSMLINHAPHRYPAEESKLSRAALQPPMVMTLVGVCHGVRGVERCDPVVPWVW